MASSAARLILRALEGLDRGRLEVTTPDGTVSEFGGPPGSGPEVRVRVHNWAFFRRMLLDGDTGVGESYIRGEWEADDLVGLIRLAIANTESLEAATPLAWFGRALDLLRHRLRGNTISGSRRNIQQHYDLSNEFFALFLDPSMTYSCGFFVNSDDSLEQAQLNKYRRIAEKARLAPYDRVLEIGCGWGGFAEFAAREYGCQVTGITISEEQARYARERMRRAGLHDRVSIELVDYRQMSGRFDKIVSIEMLEAVGHEYLSVFFGKLDELLEPDGLAVVQVITIPDQRYSAYRRRPDYIQKFVFPGGHLPSLQAMVDAVAGHTGLSFDGLENIGTHYAETLRRWRLGFLERADKVRSLGFDDAFIRRWEYYLAYCEGGFADRYIYNLQFVLSRAANRAHFSSPYVEAASAPSTRSLDRVLAAGAALTR
jgi:cyclopropane-fatty-acyl-phospholipid synthase